MSHYQVVRRTSKVIIQQEFGGGDLVLHHILWGLYKLLTFTLMYSLSYRKYWYSSEILACMLTNNCYYIE